MDETNNVVLEEMEAETGAPGEPDDWDDIDLSDVSDNSEEEPAEGESEDADQQSEEEPERQAESQEKPTGEDEPQEGQSEADQLFTLKHLDSTYQVDRNQVVALAQKGLDYDRIRARADQEISRLTVYEEFLKELAEPGNMTIEELMDTTRAGLMAQRDGIDHDVALQRVKLDRERRDLEARRRSMDRQTEANQQQAQQKARIQQSIDRFIQAHPGLDAKDIPQTVWDDFAAGKDLSDAYAVHEARQLRDRLEDAERELETLRQNKSNQARTTGSQTDAGSRKESAEDEFDRMWYDGT